MWHRRGPGIVPTWRGIMVIVMVLIAWAIGIITMIANSGS